MSQTAPFRPVRDLPVGALLTHLAEVLPDRDALVYPSTRLRFAELERDARVIAKGLMAAGVGAGERVALWAAPSMSAAVSFRPGTSPSPVKSPAST